MSGKHLLRTLLAVSTILLAVAGDILVTQLISYVKGFMSNLEKSQCVPYTTTVNPVYVII